MRKRRHEEERRLLIVRSGARVPGHRVGQAHVDARARAESGLRQDRVVVEAAAQRDVHARRHLLRGLQVGAGLVRAEPRVEKERVDAGHRRVRRVVAVGRFHRVADAERLEAATGLHRVEKSQVHGEVVLDRRLAFARVLEVDDRAPCDDDLGWHARRRRALRHQVFHLLAHLGFGVGDAEQAHAARPEGALPVEARGAAPSVVADVEVGDLVFEVVDSVRPSRTSSMPAMLTIQMRSRGVRSYTALALNE